MAVDHEHAGNCVLDDLARYPGGGRAARLRYSSCPPAGAPSGQRTRRACRCRRAPEGDGRPDRRLRRAAVAEAVTPKINDHWIGTTHILFVVERKAAGILAMTCQEAVAATRLALADHPADDAVRHATLAWLTDPGPERIAREHDRMGAPRLRAGARWDGRVRIGHDSDGHEQPLGGRARRDRVGLRRAAQPLTRPAHAGDHASRRFPVGVKMTGRHLTFTTT